MSEYAVMTVTETLSYPAVVHQETAKIVARFSQGDDETAETVAWALNSHEDWDW